MHVPLFAFAALVLTAWPFLVATLLFGAGAAVMGMALGDYPRGQVTIGGVAMYQITDFNYTHTNGAKLRSTLRKDPAGSTRGARAVSFSFNVILPDDPADQDDVDWQNAVKYKIPQLILLKLPAGERIMLDCFFSEEGTEITLEDGCKKPIKGSGYFADLGN
jgi:hypothetical protein